MLSVLSRDVVYTASVPYEKIFATQAEHHFSGFGDGGEIGGVRNTQAYSFVVALFGADEGVGPGEDAAGRRRVRFSKRAPCGGCADDNAANLPDSGREV
jgi:hypothetical protein